MRVIFTMRICVALNPSRGSPSDAISTLGAATAAIPEPSASAGSAGPEESIARDGPADTLPGRYEPEE